jgi:RNA polymerase sigma-70 factor, ECF subfamily
MEESDGSLIAAIREGSDDATETLIRRHWGRCHRLAYLILGDAAGAEDVTQEAMLSALRGLGGFDRELPFEPWLHRIVVNRSRDWLRARARRPEIVGLEVDPDTGETGRPDLPQELPEELLEAVRGLRPDYRIVVVMRHVLDYAPAEIAEVLAIPAATVRTRLRRALIEIRQTLQRKEASSECAQ